MSPLFQTRPGQDPLAAIVVGIGAMGMSWCRAVCAHPDLELVGLADIDPRRARGAAIRLRRPDLPVAESLDGLACTAADVCVNVTPPDAHFAVTYAALARGLAVLSEKPFAATLTEAARLTAMARSTGRLLMVSQSRSYLPGVARLRDLAAGLGSLGLVSTELILGYRPGGFRVALAQPLLLDMAVHAFDAVRLITGARPLRVYCDAFNPPWSWFSGPAAAIVIAEMTGGIRYSFTGSWCSDGLPTSWNGRWRVSGEHGTASWDGVGSPRLEQTSGQAPAESEQRSSGEAGVRPLPATASDGSGLAAPLEAFVRALRTGVPPWGECEDNLLTMTMTEAAVASTVAAAPVATGPLLARAWREAQ